MCMCMHTCLCVFFPQQCTAPMRTVQAQWVLYKLEKEKKWETEYAIWFSCHPGNWEYNKLVPYYHLKGTHVHSFCCIDATFPPKKLNKEISPHTTALMIGMEIQNGGAIDFWKGYCETSAICELWVNQYIIFMLLNCLCHLAVQLIITYLLYQWLHCCY